MEVFRDNKASRLIHVAVGILVNDSHEVLIAQRLPHQYAPGLWEFPGGKVEAGESVYAALEREFHEEIGIDILSAHAWFHITHDYSDRVVLLDVWWIDHFKGEPRGVEGQVILWVPLSQLQTYEFPAGNALIIEKLSHQCLG